ncbi:TetR/AcrR family transcriptional regulator [Carboxylicivirga linearis]|uniref:TetR/AcrR family transcriptional regulator n=1 Tax=Carboxylicivirga linearis TaxID=1628157 RepID=A0ABS5JQJ2_9BACT|nr:TetR/AcrR family transcriptional regulator [Carboxylicivirga linearis]MBS2097146.1 TetR/AcrR family transcriptional regulator [Carboxylicivirga linearis]
MSIGIKISLNPKLYLRDPQETPLGQKIIKNSILLIDEIGFESFTFKKLAGKIKSTEASIYRYFENKHLLLIYLVSWYWEWLSYLIDINTLNIESSRKKLNIIIDTLVEAYRENPAIEYVNESILQRLVIAEGAKAYHTKAVDKDNKDGFFINFKELSEKIAKVIEEVDPQFKYPHALASNLIEMANNHSFFAVHLPRLTDIKISDEDYSPVKEMLCHFVSKLLNNEKP